MSAIAGVTKPMMIKGMRNCRKLLNRLLKVANILAAGSGRKSPQTIPDTIAVRILGSNPNLNSLLL